MFEAADIVAEVIDAGAVDGPAMLRDLRGTVTGNPSTAITDVCWFESAAHGVGRFLGDLCGVSFPRHIMSGAFVRESASGVVPQYYSMESVTRSNGRTYRKRCWQ